ncbi:MAG TPA: hypothetical protein VMP01_27045 [Pirellulaceae bacterium]|nr:hypothetical protein [Pirellulaceae bacterium]
MSAPLPQPSLRNAEDAPPQAESAEAFDPAEAEQQILANRIAALMAQGKNGAHWFYWVAALSLVTSLIILGGGETHFVIGLGITLLASGMAAGFAQQAPEAALTLQIIAVAFSLFVSAIVALFGWMSAKRYTAVMAIGMGLYFLDGALYLLIQDWMSIAFHAFALYCMWTGMSAFRELNALEQSLASPRELVAEPFGPAV